MYLREKSLKAEQAMQNLAAALSSDYFGNYGVLGRSRINTDLIRLVFGGFMRLSQDNWQQAKAKEFSEITAFMSRFARTKARIIEAYVELEASQEEVSKLGFEKKLLEEDFSLKLSLSIDAQKTGFAFRAANLGFDKGYFQEHNLDYQDATSRLDVWYQKLDRNFKKILPHKF